MERGAGHWTVQMNQLTDRQKRVYEYIVEHARKHGFPPTRSDIAIAMGFKSDNAAQEHLEALQKAGYIELTPLIARGIKIVVNMSTS
jgi:repressor LexA